MATSSVRTRTHSYPREELDAMAVFYRGQRCVVQNMLGTVQFAHFLDAALEPSNLRLSEMLTRNLRLDRYPMHGAEVRENLVPHHHTAMDVHLPQSTLFLHEDVLARTLAYEQDLLQWRIEELDAGRGDPGRPSYDEVFGGRAITPHRYHTKIGAFVRERNNSSGFDMYLNVDCPGIDDPASQNVFPVIETLLSIPFSLLHTLPRLIAMVPLSHYQHQLITMGLEITRLWWWDPSPDMIKKSDEIRAQKIAAKRYRRTRKAKPHPIHHPSRSNITFTTKQPIITFGTPTTCLSIRDINRDAGTVHLPSGQVFLGAKPALFWNNDGLKLTPGNEGAADKAIVAGLSRPPPTSDIWDFQSVDVPEDSDNNDHMEAKSAIRPSPCDIISWREGVVEPGAKPLPLTPTPFERGSIGGLSTNDILMMKGLITPPVYLQFLNLRSLPCR